MRLSLSRLLPADGERCALPVLLLHGFGQNRRTWMLSRRSFAAFLVAAGYEVYQAELRGHGRSQLAGSLLPQDLAELTDLDLPALVRYALEISGRRQLLLVGHSMGGMVALAAPFPLQRSLAGIAVLATPGLGGRAADPLRRAVGTAVELAWRANPLSLVKHVAFPLHWVGWAAEHCLPLLDEQRTHWQLAMWYPQSIERDLLLELLREGFTAEGLGLFFAVMCRTLRGADSAAELVLRERAAAQQAPVLLLAGNHDRLVPPRAVERWLRLLRTEQKSYVCCGSEQDGVRIGHCDIVVGRHARRHVWPLVRDWLDARG